MRCTPHEAGTGPLYPDSVPGYGLQVRAPDPWTELLAHIIIPSRAVAAGSP